MKQLILVFLVVLISIPSFAQFTDTAQLNQYIRDTITDRRPSKITAAQIQKSLLDITTVLGAHNYFNTNLSNNTGGPIHHNARGQQILTDSIPMMEWILADSTTPQAGDLLVMEGGMNYNLSSGQSYYLGPGLDASNLDNINIQLSDGTSMYVGSGTFNLSNMSFVTIGDGVQNLAIGTTNYNFGDNSQFHSFVYRPQNYYGFNYSNTNSNAFFNTSTGTVNIATPAGAMVMNSDSTSLYHSGIGIHIDDSTIVLHNDSLANGGANGNYLTTDETGNLQLQKAGYRLGPGLTLTDTDSLYFGGTNYEGVNLTINNLENVGTAYLTMDTTAFDIGYQGVYANFDNNGIYMNGGANQQIVTAGTLKLSTNGVELGHTDNYYNTRSDVTIDVNGNVTFANNNLLSGDANGQYLTTDGSGNLFLKTVPVYTLPDTVTISQLRVNGTGYFQDSLTLYNVADGSATDSLLVLSTNDVVEKRAPSIITSGQFNLTNNQTVPTDITGFSVDPNSHKAFQADYTIVRKYNNGLVAGNLDNIFSILSKNNSFNIGISGLSHPIAQQSSGKYILGTNATQFAGVTINRILRLNTDYSIDQTFLTNTGSGFNNTVSCVTVQPDDKILCAGSFTSFNGHTRNYLVRLNADGTEDAAFYTNLGTGFGSNVNFIAVLASGKILVGGNFTTFNSHTRKYLVRLNTDGTEDTAFYTNLGTGFNTGIIMLYEQPSDNKILIGGGFTTLNGNTRDYLVRLNADGTEDTSFYINLGTSFNSAILNIAVQPADSKILIGGSFTTLNGNTRHGLVRLNADGTEDASFGINVGSGAFPGNGIGINCVTLDSSGHIYIAGYFSSWNGNNKNQLVRLNADGTEDLTFSAGMGTIFPSGLIGGLAVLPTENRLFCISYTSPSSGTPNSFLLKIVTNTAENAELITTGTLLGRFVGGAYNQWAITTSNTGFADYTGINLSMTNTGQLQYTSSNLPGTQTADYIVFVIRPM